jgi:hypothetical protein
VGVVHSRPTRCYARANTGRDGFAPVLLAPEDSTRRKSVGFLFPTRIEQAPRELLQSECLFQRLSMSERKVLVLILVCYVAVFAIVLFLRSQQ